MVLRALAWCLLSLSLLLVMPDGSSSRPPDVPDAGTAVPIAVQHLDDLDPSHLVIPALQVDADMVAAPTTIEYDPFLGKNVESFGVPADMRSTTWWSGGPRPGAAGLAVVLGHTQVGGQGVFDRLGDLAPGDRVEVRGPTGSRTAGFRVVEVISGIAKSDPGALGGVLSAHHDLHGLALITCGGEFDATVGASEDNTIVIAVAQD